MSAEFVEYCLELLTPLGGVQARRMFGAQGLFKDGLMIGLISRERLYFKADAHSRAAFEAAGCEVFAYTTGAGRRVELPYWSAPDEALESAAALQVWARRALDAALRSRAEADRAQAQPRRSAPSQGASQRRQAARRPARG